MLLLCTQFWRRARHPGDRMSQPILLVEGKLRASVRGRSKTRGGTHRRGAGGWYNSSREQACRIGGKICAAGQVALEQHQSGKFCLIRRFANFFGYSWYDAETKAEAIWFAYHQGKTHHPCHAMNCMFFLLLGFLL